MENKECANQNLLNAIDRDVDSYYNFMIDQSEKIRGMKEQYTNLVEYKNTISSAASILNRA